MSNNISTLTALGIECQLKKHQYVEKLADGSFRISNRGKTSSIHLRALVNDVLGSYAIRTDQEKSEIDSAIASLKLAHELKNTKASRFFARMFCQDKLKSFDETYKLLAQHQPTSVKPLTDTAKRIDYMVALTKHRGDRKSHLGLDGFAWLSFVATLMPDSKSFVELFKGAHVKIPDKGHAYVIAQAQFDSRPRFSSHYSKEKTQQYGVADPFWGELLYGKEGDNSWFQFEKTPFSWSVSCLIGHSLDYIKYKIKAMNVGPDGLSKFTDQNPLKVKLPAENVASVDTELDPIVIDSSA